MIKISYHKHAHKHEAVIKAKKMLNTIEKKFCNHYIECFSVVQLTGINEIDRQEVKCCIEDHLKNLKKNIEEQLFQNQKFIDGIYNLQYDEGYHTPALIHDFKLIKELDETYSFILNSYPKIELKKSEIFVFTTKKPEDKYNEIVNHFKENIVTGYNKEYFAVLENGIEKKLYPQNFSSQDLSDAVGVYLLYQ